MSTYAFFLAYIFIDNFKTLKFEIMYINYSDKELKTFCFGYIFLQILFFTVFSLDRLACKHTNLLNAHRNLKCINKTTPDEKLAQNLILVNFDGMGYSQFCQNYSKLFDQIIHNENFSNFKVFK